MLTDGRSEINELLTLKDPVLLYPGGGDGHSILLRQILLSTVVSELYARESRDHSPSSSDEYHQS